MRQVMSGANRRLQVALPDRVAKSARDKTPLPLLQCSMKKKEVAGNLRSVPSLTRSEAMLWKVSCVPPDTCGRIGDIRPAFRARCPVGRGNPVGGPRYIGPPGSSVLRSGAFADTINNAHRDTAHETRLYPPRVFNRLCWRDRASIVP